MRQHHVRISTHTLALALLFVVLFSTGSGNTASAAKRQRTGCTRAVQGHKRVCTAKSGLKSRTLSVSSAAESTVSAGPVNAGSVNDERLAVVNAARSVARSCGANQFPAVPPVRWDTRLEAAAREHSVFQASTNTLSHVGEGASNPLQRIQRQGVASRVVGEDVAWNYESTQATLNGWLASEGHCVLVMSPTFTAIGWAKQGAYDTMDFAS